jgi:hypothetical protein
MALTIKHTKVSTIPDGADTGLVRPSDWNADHSLTGVASIAQGGTGQTTANAAVNALLPAQTGQAGKVLGTDGTNTSWVASGGGGGNVNSIIAGTGISINPTSGQGNVTITATGGSSLSGTTQSVSPFETSLGFEAGNANTGVNNTYLGFQAGRACTGAVNNVAIGYQALDVATIPASNVVIGASACGSTNTTQQNVIIGANANATATSNAGNNTFIGFDVGRATTGGSNIFIGSGSGTSATTATTIVAIGNGTLGTATSTAAGAVAVGHNSLGSLTTGARNTAIGGQSGQTLITGSDNTFLGFDTGKLVTGNSNTYVGALAGDVATSGANNAAFGWNSGGAITTGGSNTLIGTNAGNLITTGSNNTIIGAYAGTTALAGQVVLSDGAGTIRQAFNNAGALSFDNTAYGNIGDVLKSNSSVNRPTWGLTNQFRFVNVNVTNGINPSDAITFADAATGGFTLTLPSAAAYPGLQLSVKRIDTVGANILTIASAGGTIEGLTTQTLGPSVSCIYASDGTNWWELANG